MPEDTIWIVTDDVSEQLMTDGGKGDWGDVVQRSAATSKGVKLNVAELEQKMADFLQVVGRLFRRAEQQSQQQAQQVGGQARMQLNEVELEVEISAEGEIKLIAGVKAAGKGAITLKFKRVEVK